LPLKNCIIVLDPKSYRIAKDQSNDERKIILYLPFVEANRAGTKQSAPGADTAKAKNERSAAREFMFDPS
jgi:hypothetical protein